MTVRSLAVKGLQHATAAHPPWHGARLPPIKIGALTVWPPIVQAPMAAISTWATRLVAEQHGCGMTVTEFLPASGLNAARPRVLLRLHASGGGTPYAVQIFGRAPEQLYRAAQSVVQAGAELVDFNMGCPAKKVTRGQCGAALMREPALAVELICAIREGVAGRIPVTVKMRSGWDAAHKNAPELALLLQQAGVAAVTIHGRTREQRFAGNVDYQLIARVKQAVRVPVIANGDIVDVDSLARALERSGADAAMIGRAAVGDPWIFSRLRAWCEKKAIPAPPTAQQRVAMYVRHCRLHVAQLQDEALAIREMRSFAQRYLAAVPAAKTLLAQVFAQHNLQEVEQVLNGFGYVIPIGVEATEGVGDVELGQGRDMGYWRTDGGHGLAAANPRGNTNTEL